MSSFIKLTAFSGILVTTAGLLACSSDNMAMDQASAKEAELQNYRPNNCKSGYSQTAQKGCVQDVPFWKTTLHK